MTRLARRVLGLRRVIEVEGVSYRETNAVPLAKAIASPKLDGKKYEVSFQGERGLTITATAERRYADLMDDLLFEALKPSPELVRPGSRVLLLGAGTGASAALASRWTGPHGGVVAIEHDAESVRFARRRYRGPAISFERGGARALAGEMDGAFNTVIVSQPWAERTGNRGASIAEAWRVTDREGLLVLVGTGLPQIDMGDVRVLVKEGAPGTPGLIIARRVQSGDRDDPT